MLLQHVLPTGLRRVRDYGFLHGNAKKLLHTLQWILRVDRPPRTPHAKARFRCPHCRGDMIVIAMILPIHPRPG